MGATSFEPSYQAYGRGGPRRGTATTPALAQQPESGFAATELSSVSYFRDMQSVRRHSVEGEGHVVRGKRAHGQALQRRIVPEAALEPLLLYVPTIT